MTVPSPMFIDDDFSGFESLSAELRICRIRQTDEKDNLGRVIRPAGMFYWSDGTLDSEDLPLIVIGFMKGRQYWKERASSGPPYCSSPNGEVGVSSDPTLDGLACANCPNARFVNKTPPLCGRNVKLLCLDSDFKPFQLQFTESGIKPTEEWLSTLVHNRNIGPPFRWFVKLGRDFVSRPGITGYYIPRWPKVGSSDRSVLQELNSDAVVKVRTLKQEYEPVFKSINSPRPVGRMLSATVVVNPPTTSPAPTPSTPLFKEEVLEAEVVEEKRWVSPEQVKSSDPFSILDLT